MSEDLLRVEFGDKVISSKFYSDVSPIEQEKLKQDVYEKPMFTLVQWALCDIFNGSTNVRSTHTIDSYYVADLLYKTKYKNSAISVAEALDNIDALRLIKGNIESHPKVYEDRGRTHGKVTLTKESFLSFCSIGNSRLVKKVYNFPIKYVDYIIDNYRPLNDRVYDYSCGWGNRMLGTLRNNCMYCGTDPNVELVPRLKKEYHDFKDLFDSLPDIDIRCTGSEVLHEDWINTMGLSFSSPPYYDLELYPNISYQSTISAWEKEYLYPTIRNVYLYLVPNAYFVMNIKDFDDYKFGDMVKTIADSVGFKYIGTDVLKSSNQRVQLVNGAKTLIENSEPLYVFQKPNC